MKGRRTILPFALLHVRVGEEAVLKTVGPKGLAGSNPVCSAVTMADLAMQRIVVPPYMGSNPISHLNWKYNRLQPG